MLRPSSHAPGRTLGKAEKENPEEHTSCLEITDKLSCSGELNLFVWFCKKELWPACWSYDCNTIETDFETRRRLSEYSEFAEDALALKLLLKVWSMEPQCGLHGKRIRKGWVSEPVHIHWIRTGSLERCNSNALCSWRDLGVDCPPGKTMCPRDKCKAELPSCRRLSTQTGGLRKIMSQSVHWSRVWIRKIKIK